jgi:hypothetical protein
MRHASAVVAAAVSCLAGAFASASAKADVFDFSFGPGVSGTFTTGAAASDPGYELITGLTFAFLFSFTEVGKDFEPGAAFNPTTDAFINHSGGGAFDDIGLFFINGNGGEGQIGGSSFSQGSDSLSGTLEEKFFKVDAPLVITRGATPVPEASTWAMMLLGFAGLGFAARRRLAAESRQTRFWNARCGFSPELKGRLRMRYASAIFAAAVSCLAGAFGAASAKADVFDFSFGSGVSGTFTTGAAASDPGYKLITGLTFDLLSGTSASGVKFSFTDVLGGVFANGAAFNPTTDAFINYAMGVAVDEIGDFDLKLDSSFFGSIQGDSFSRTSNTLLGELVPSPGEAIVIDIVAPLKITPTLATPVPEASTWAMMLLGFGGLGWLGFAACRWRLRAVPAA